MHISNVTSTPTLEAAKDKSPISKVENGAVPASEPQADGHTSHTHQSSMPSMPGMGEMVDEMA